MLIGYGISPRTTTASQSLQEVLTPCACETIEGKEIRRPLMRKPGRFCNLTQPFGVWLASLEIFLNVCTPTREFTMGILRGHIVDGATGEQINAKVHVRVAAAVEAR